MRLPAKRLFSTTAATLSTPKIYPIPILPSASLADFRAHAFSPSKPAILPRGTFSNLPATRTWTLPATSTTPTRFNTAYFLPHADATLLPTEYTSPGASPPFVRTSAPLAMFLNWAELMQQQTSPSPSPPTPRLTIAQSPLSLLPPALLSDLSPTPELVRHAGRGDVYADSLWLGLAPTATPLHRDPNPNLLVQVAGRKRVRMLAPGAGEAVWARVRGERGDERGRVRGEEMMVGREREVLEGVVWGEGEKGEERLEMWEGEIGAGDGVFIPVGWWHAVRGEGEGAVASVNWWFR